MKGGEEWHSAGIKDAVLGAAAAGFVSEDSLADVIAEGAAGDGFVELVTECKNCP